MFKHLKFDSFHRLEVVDSFKKLIANNNPPIILKN